MNVRGGDIRQFKWWGKELDIAQDASLTVFLPGTENTNLPNGNGSLHTNQKRQLGGIDGIVASCDPSRGDLEFFQGKATNGVAGPLQMTLVNGYTYIGTMAVEGQVALDTGAGTMSMAARGEKLAKVAG